MTILKNNTMQIYLIALVCFILLLLPTKSFANYDACELITEMLINGRNNVFKPHVGQFIRGEGIVAV